MEVTAVELTPARVKFLESSIAGFSLPEWGIELAGQAASTRLFFRVSRPEGPAAAREPRSYILVEWDSRDEDWPRFFDIEAYVSPSTGVLPKIYASDPSSGMILEEDLGALTLKQFCADNAGNRGVITGIYFHVLSELCKWQNLNVAGCPPIASRAMDEEVFMWESSYFAQHCVAGCFGKEGLLTAGWEAERLRMARAAAGIPRVCIHRDFQSENILVQAGGRVRFVDYQGARMGPPYYDVASLVFDPYVNLDSAAMGDLIKNYLLKTGILNGTPPKEFYICAAQRLMQALGAYGNLSIHKGKPHYRQFIPPALERLAYVLEFLPDYPATGQIVKNCLP
jgi:hypothetical protein